jgi:hypothetical protein
MEEKQTKTKNVYVELEMLEHMPLNANKSSLYPHSGNYLLKRDDDTLSVVYVEIDSDKEYCSQFIETFIGSKPFVPVGSLVHVNELKAVEERLQDEYSKKRMELEHEYEIKTLKIEQETPKRFEQGEWVSGQTLTEIIKTLSVKKD